MRDDISNVICDESFQMKNLKNKPADATSCFVFQVLNDILQQVQPDLIIVKHCQDISKANSVLPTLLPRLLSFDPIFYPISVNILSIQHIVSLYFFKICFQ